ncbi:MAG: hypothetical protein RLO12_20710 [Fulvivirga sp.]
MKNLRIFYLLVAVAVTSCSSEDGADGLVSLIEIDEEPAGANCEFGGLIIKTGIDNNANGILEAEEVTAIKYVCDGADGTDGQNGTNGVDGVDGSGNKETRINLVEVANLQYYFSSYDVIATRLIQFNISNYVADSAALIGLVNSQSFDSTPVNIRMELVDLADTSLLDNAFIEETVTSSDTVVVLSKTNFISSFPNQTINIGLRTNMYKESPTFNIGSLDLILYKKD